MEFRIEIYSKKFLNSQERERKKERKKQERKGELRKNLGHDRVYIKNQKLRIRKTN